MLPTDAPWLVDGKLVLFAARGETLGLQIFHRVPGAVTLRFDPVSATDSGNVTVRAFSVDPVTVRRASTQMYGGTQGTGDYHEALAPADAPITNPAYLEIVVGRDATPGTRTGELVVAGQRVAATLTITNVTLPPLRLDVWAYFDQRELAWASGRSEQPAKATPRAADAAERACVELFRAHGVLLAPDLTLAAYTARTPLM